jgi:hypothetical protein
MKTYSANAAQELAAWLVLATFGLVPPARERIKREIEAHFADAVVAHVAEGLSQESAETMALEELGDIHSAAKAFQKKHITEEEEKWLHDLPEEYRLKKFASRFRYFWTLFFSIWLTICVLKWSDTSDIRLTCLSLAPLWFFIVISSAYWLRWSSSIRHLVAGPEFLRKLLVLGMINDVFLSVFQMSLSLLYLSDHLNNPLRAVGWCLFVLSLVGLGLFYFYKPFRVWRKLGYSLASPDMGMEA